MNQRSVDDMQRMSALQRQLLAIIKLEETINTLRVKVDVDVVENGIEFFLLLAYISQRKAELLAAAAGHQQSMMEAGK